MIADLLDLLNETAGACGLVRGGWVCSLPEHNDDRHYFVAAVAA